MINVDLAKDWNDFLKNDMPALGLGYDLAQSAWENTLRYLGAKRRVPRQVPRNVHEARELCIPPTLASDYAALKKLIEQGGNLTAYLSRDIGKKKADKNDRLLNAWGIQHLHFRPGGTSDVLFVKFTDSEAFVLQTLPHGSGHPGTWVDTSLLEILHNNWPEAADGKIAGIAGEPLTSKQREALRKVNANFATEMPGGVVYLGPGGLTASGHCVYDIQETDGIFEGLAKWQRIVESNETNFREALGVFPPEELSIRLMIVAGNWWLYEPVTQRRLLLTQERGANSDKLDQDPG
jgi:hypothetical protein